MKLSHPLPSGVTTASYGAYDGHRGHDWAADGDTPILAAHAGTVAYAGWEPNGGWMVNVTDDSGGFATSYQHMIRQPSVHVGEHVTVGQVLGGVGSTGYSTGNHLHFELWVGGPVWSDTAYPVNPLPYIGQDSLIQQKEASQMNRAMFYMNGATYTVIIGNPLSGWSFEYVTGMDSFNNSMAKLFDTGSFVEVDQSVYDVFKRSLTEVRATP